MAYIKQYGSVILHRRDAWGGDTWASGGARWAFFAIFIVLILIVIFGTLRVNKKRSRQGVQPLYGTRWMTPPSYRQSQTQYDQPDNLSLIHILTKYALSDGETTEMSKLILLVFFEPTKIFTANIAENDPPIITTFLVVAVMLKRTIRWLDSFSKLS